MTSLLPHATLQPSHNVKLQKIFLPWFNGSPLKWSGFLDPFNLAVHSNPELSEAEKFNYLHSLLEGSAHDAIAGLMLSSANYKEGIQILNKWFGDKQIIISKLMQSLLGVEAVESDKSLCSLRWLFDEVESHICSFKGLGDRCWILWRHAHSCSCQQTSTRHTADHWSKGL